jgi:hypothetical protein
MDHIKQRWAKTQMAEDFAITPRGFGAPPYGIVALHDLQQPEAAHAASELDDWQPMPTRHAVVFWLALLGVPALVVALGLWMALA